MAQRLAELTVGTHAESTEAFDLSAYAAGFAGGRVDSRLSHG